MEVPKRIWTTESGRALVTNDCRWNDDIAWVRAAEADALADALESIATRDRRAREIGDEYEVIEDMTAIAVKALAAYREKK